ncbi:trypsin-like peptidase domain-containing protein [Tropicibacter sp. R15_0]|uniref:trypsin-like peptidase domain-containing protein n=1 Tax=Tropicibacter sp. R15_0 TaxID=2821101 RepID=UPI001ADBBDE1|nr:trypsin-like peptidase domain-containing protein [Tropicibacter sp. R15_0]MBO9466038.1 trypsin-like peptidase domain-containing protein [Tropicibacter sp. R15_0]
MRRILLTTAITLFPAISAGQELMLFDASTFGDVVLRQNQSAMVGVELEAQIGSYNNEFIANYGTQSVFARAGRSVGRLDILTDKGHAPCTAFLLNDNRLMTNHHCVPGILENDRLGASSIISVQFKAGYVRDGIEEGVKTFHVNPQPLESSKDLDYSVLKLIGDANSEFGALELSAAEPISLAPLWIIGHPMGEAQRISREKCQADDPALASGRVRHTCDTLPGNSGSPVLDADSKLVVALHHAGSRAGAVNFAVPMRDILAQSAILTPAAQPAPLEEPDNSAELAALAKELAELKAERDRLLKETQDKERVTTPRILQATPLDPKYWRRGPNRVPEERQPIQDADLSVDGKYAAIATKDVARIWSLDEERYVWTLKHEGSVYGAHFSPDGARLVTASSDKTARIWDVATGEQLVSLRGHEGWVADARFSPDGTVIATVSGGQDGPPLGFKIGP